MGTFLPGTGSCPASNDATALGGVEDDDVGEPRDRTAAAAPSSTRSVDDRVAVGAPFHSSASVPPGLSTRASTASSAAAAEAGHAPVADKARGSGGAAADLEHVVGG
jgi:hypothetical protein